VSMLQQKPARDLRRARVVPATSEGETGVLVAPIELADGAAVQEAKGSSDGGSSTNEDGSDRDKSGETHGWIEQTASGMDL
jgi:hypothetical protein